MIGKPSPGEALAAIRAHCLNCSGGSRKEVHECKVTNCALWRFREIGATKKPETGRQLTIEIIGEAIG